MASCGEGLQGTSMASSDKPHLYRWPVVIALVAVVMTATWNVSQWWNRPRGVQFDVEYNYGLFQLPPHIRIPEADALQTPGTEEVEQLRYELADVRHSLTVAQSARGYIQLSIKNVGDSPAEGVALQWQGEGLASISKQDGTTSAVEFDDRLEIGRIPVHDTVAVALWTRSEFSSIASQPLIIAHDHGSEIVINTDYSRRTLTEVIYRQLVIGSIMLCIMLPTMRIWAPVTNRVIKWIHRRIRRWTSRELIYHGEIGPPPSSRSWRNS